MKNYTFTIAILLINIFVSAQVFPVEEIQNSGDDRINIVVLSDGYQASELDQFKIDAQNFTDALFAETPYKEYKDYFNVYIIKVPSNESGANHPGTGIDVTEPSHPVKVVDNYFGSTFDFNGIHRLLVPTKTIKITNVLAANFPTYDQIVVLVNSPFYGGSGGREATASLHINSDEIAIHEIGHSFVELIDEYWAGEVFAREGINMTQNTNPSTVKWKNWHGDNGIGIYPHSGSGSASSWNKPHQNCKMQFLNNPFCAVCIEGTIEEIHSLLSPIVLYTPANLNVDASSFPINFNLELIKPNPNTLKTKWMLNGVEIQGSLEAVSITELELNQGSNTVVAQVEDKPTLIRVDNHPSSHIHTVHWNILNSPVGIEEITSSSNQFSVDLLPNPVVSNLKAKFIAEVEADLRIDIYNSNGQLLKSIKPRGEDVVAINVEDFSKGVYLVNFYADDHLLTTKEIIKH